MARARIADFIGVELIADCQWKAGGAVGLSGRLSRSQVEKESRSVNRPL